MTATNIPQAQIVLHSLQHGSSIPHKVKTPTVQQALPFTPFTSIVPFDAAIIKAPSLTTVKAANIDIPNTHSTQELLSRVDAASFQCQRTLRDVQKLLQTNNLTYFKFRKPVTRMPKDHEPAVVEPPKLSNFAKMVFDSVPIEIEYASPTPKKATGTPQSQQHRNEKIVHSHNKALNQAAQQHNARESIKGQPPMVAAGMHGTVRKAQPPSPATEQHPVVRVSTGAHATVKIDQRAKGSASVQNLTQLLDEIFAADDTIVAGDDMNHEILSIFRFLDNSDGPSHALAPAYQTRLEIAVQKAASASRLDSIPTEHLKRTQKLCDDLVQLSAEASLRIANDWSDSDIEDWEQRLYTADTSLLGIRVLLKIMTAGSADRELQSEDLVRSLLKVMRVIAETGVVAMVETHGEKKSSDVASNARFTLGMQHHDQILLVLRGFTKALRSLGSLLAKVNVDESAISGIVYMCKILIFAENASNDRDSILGVQTYEASRRHAMEVLAKVFDRYPEQRQFIFDEILLSLEKLPGTKQSARQFRLPDAKPIQLVSALIMQLIQTSATRGGTRISVARTAENEESSPDDDTDASEDDLAESDTSKKDQTKDLRIMITPLDQATQGGALYVTKTLIQRALNTAKTADEPHRKLLDIFTEDFMNVLGLPEWPSAELLLRCLLRQMIAIIENKTSPVSSRNFALESLSRMGSGILDVQAQAQSHAKGVVAAESVVTNKMTAILQQSLDGSAPSEDMLHLEGPYRVVLEYLHGKRHDEAQIHTAIGYDLLQWAQQACSSREGSAESDASESPSVKTMQSRLRSMIIDPQWFETNVAFDNISIAEGRIASLVITTNSPFYKAFSKIFSVLLTNMSSEHSTVKSKSLRSVITLIETDPSVLDRNTYIMRSIMRCSEDSSPLVRDAALGLVARCMELRPQLDAKIYEHIISRLEDSAIGVRKRAMRMLKDIYLRNDDNTVRSIIAGAMVGRFKDPEESVVDLAKQTIEEVWFQPLYTSSLRNQSETNVKVAYHSQAVLLVHAVESSDEMPETLASLLQDLLHESKSGKENIAVSRKLIEVLFNGIIDSADFSESVTQGMLLQVLAVFAQASPKLLTASQLELLEPYTRNLISNEDLTIFRLALTILRYSMPYAKGLQKNFLADLQKALLGTLGKLPNTEFPEVAVCLWAIDGELKNTEILVKVVCSALTTVRSLVGKDSTEAVTANKLTRLMALVGQFGKACDLEAHYSKVKSSIPGAKSSTVAGVIVETLASFGSAKQPMSVREGAIQSICAVCQRWPKHYLRPDVGGLFDALLKDNIPVLDGVFLEGLLNFFSGQESSAPNASDSEADATGRERLAKTYVATDQDGAAASLSQRYLQHILRLATGSVDDQALVATKLVASIVRQGLPHPKECGPSLIALETSPNAAIAQVACAEHRTMHEKHETIIEKEYVRSMDRALSYQQDVLHDAKGWTGMPPTPKLHFFLDVLKGGKAKARQKFLVNICSKLTFEPTQHGLPEHLAFVRFMVENLALFDFDRMEDIKLTVDNLSKAFATTGTSLAQAIDSEVFNMNVTALESSQAENDGAQTAAPLVDGSRLITLAVSSQILLLIAEARDFLVRSWGGHKSLKKEKAKETSKGPTRSVNVAALAEAFVRRTEQLMQPCVDQSSQTEMCRAFAEVVSTDNEVDIGSDDEDGPDDDCSPVRDTRSPSAALAGTPSSRKRKSVALGVQGPRKRGRPRKTPSFIRGGGDEDAGD